MARGRESIDARLDLHGMTQSRAHAALLRFLRKAQADDVRIALVVTGKGTARADGHHGGERGVLKRQVPLGCRCRNSVPWSSASRTPISAMAGRARSMCGCAEPKERIVNDAGGMSG